MDMSGNIEVGDRVHLKLSGKDGTLAFLGITSFAEGVWAGVALDEVSGKHDGEVAGVRYFSCPAMCGLFVRPSVLQLISGNSSSNSNSNISFSRTRSEHPQMQPSSIKTLQKIKPTQRDISNLSSVTSHSSSHKSSSSSSDQGDVSSNENFIVSRATAKKGDKHVNLYSNEHRISGSGGKFKHDNSPLFVFHHNIFKDAMIKARFRAEVYAVNDYLRQIETGRFREEIANKDAMLAAGSTSNDGISNCNNNNNNNNNNSNNSNNRNHNANGNAADCSDSSSDSDSSEGNIDEVRGLQVPEIASCRKEAISRRSDSTISNILASANSSNRLVNQNKNDREGVEHKTRTKASSSRYGGV